MKGKSKLAIQLSGLARSRIRVGIIAGMVILACGVLVYAAFFQSFETDDSGWFGATRVTSGTHLITSKTGAFHAEDGGGAFTRWGGYSDTFPVGGYTTSIDIYLEYLRTVWKCDDTDTISQRYAV